MIVLGIEAKDTSECRYLQADRPQDQFALFLPREKAHRYYIDHREGEFFIRTNKGGRNFEIKTAPEGDPDPKSWKTFVAHDDDVRIQEIDLFRDFAVVIERTEAIDRLRVYGFGSKTWDQIAFPEPVYAASPGGTPDYDSPTYRYNYQSFITPPSIFDYDVASAAPHY